MSNHEVSFRFDPETLKKKYEQERDKRLALRPAGNTQYVKMEGVLAHYLDDPYTERQERPARDEEVDVAILGGGFGGLLAAARLKESGIDEIRILEKGGDFGGTWYWNRYPGAACDVESYIYLPLLEEVGTIPTEKYAKAPEIFRHAQNIGRKYDLYPGTLFQTSVNELRFDEKTDRWIVKTDRGDTIRARFFVMAAGHYQDPKLPGVPGIEAFKGHSFHTSRWDYDYTGGDTYGGLTKLQDKVVGIIGTGATAIQCIPHLGEWAKHLYVFQRTPSSVDVRGNRPTDPEWPKTLQPGWQRDRMINFISVGQGIPVKEDLVNDSWTKVIHLVMQRVTADTTPEERAKLAQMADYEVMEQVRARVDETVKDAATAEALKPWYNRLCKRPCFHDEYLATFNRPNVTLVDTEGRGVERMSEEAVFANGKEYKLDCLIYATGFDLAAFTQGTVAPVYGRGGQSLARDPAERVGVELPARHGGASSPHRLHRAKREGQGRHERRSHDGGGG
jgi:cyclohexanone monooxygenase